MSGKPLHLAGKAISWQAFQMVGVKAVYLLRILILARLLTPDDFGLVAIALTSVGFLLSATDFGMIPALVQGEKMDEAHYNTAWTVGIARSIMVTGIMLAAAPVISVLFGEPRAVVFIRTLAFLPLLESLASIKVAALNRYLMFRPLAFLRLTEAIVNTGLSIALAPAFGVWGLVGSILGGAAAMAFSSYILAPHRPRISIDRGAAQPLIRFGRWIFITSLITMAGSYLLRIVITRRLGAAGLGLYFLAAHLAFLPSQVAGEIVGSVSFPLFARLRNDRREATRLFRVLYPSLATVLFPAAALLIVFASTLTHEILGPRWEGSEDVIRILALVTMIGLFGDVTCPVLKGFGKPHLIALLEMVQSFLIMALVWMLTSRFGLIGAAMAWLPAVMLSQFLSVRFIRRLLDNPFTGLSGPMAAVAAITLMCAFTASGVNNLMPGIPGLFSGGTLAVALSTALLWVMDRRYHLGFSLNLATAFPGLAAFIRLPDPAPTRNL